MWKVTRTVRRAQARQLEVTGAPLSTRGSGTKKEGGEEHAVQWAWAEWGGVFAAKFLNRCEIQQSQEVRESKHRPQSLRLSFVDVTILYSFPIGPCSWTLFAIQAAPVQARLHPP